MIIERYGITLRSLGVEDLETVRVWRNSDLVRPYMFYQEIISKSEQESWFSKLEPLNNFYFIIAHNGIQIGVCNIRDIDWSSGHCEGGIFVGEEKYLNTSVPIRAVLTACEYWFNVLAIEKVSISILKGNSVAVKFNQMLGAKEVSNSDGVISMTLSREDFETETANRRAKFDERYHEGSKEMSIISSSKSDEEILRNHRRVSSAQNDLTLNIRSL
ncbi:MAG: GNAT family N-acetyltransferase [Flavobacteriales bacterium]